MSYKTRNKKKVTLPSGATVTIRKLIGYDFLTLGEFPLAGDLVAGSKGDRKPTKSELEFSVALAKYALVHATQDFEFEGESYVIVDKPSIETTATELSIEDLDQADAQAIVDLVTQFSGFSGKGEGKKPIPFSVEEPEVGNSGSQDSEALREVAK